MTSPTASLSPSPTLALESQPDPAHAPLPSNLRRYFLLASFSAAQFMDVYSASALFVSTTTIIKDLDMSIAEGVWLINAYTLTLACCFLMSGRIADIYSAKAVFVIGFFWIGILALGIGFVRIWNLQPVLGEYRGSKSGQTMLTL